MLEDSGDKVIETANPKLKTGRKWKVQEALEAPKNSLEIREITGHTQTNQKRLQKAVQQSQQATGLQVRVHSKEASFGMICGTWPL